MGLLTSIPGNTAPNLLAKHPVYLIGDKLCRLHFGIIPE
jgi:hypothetical protein